MTKSFQFLRLLPTLESPNFRKLIIRGSDCVEIKFELAHASGLEKSFRYSSENGLKTETINLDEVIGEIVNLFESGYSEAICETDSEVISYTKVHKKIQIESRETPNLNEKAFVRPDVKAFLENSRVRRLLVALNILSKRGQIRKEQHNKLIQIKNLLQSIHDILPKVLQSRPLTIVDAACGKSYLSFVLYYYLKFEWKVPAKFICIDSNSKLIQRCRAIQESLGYDGMEFLDAKLEDIDDLNKVDMFFSLHGCDSATDEAINVAVRNQSKVLIVAPCCHFELRRQLKRHPLSALSKYGVLEEKFSSILTDAMRAIALEGLGYDVSVLRFVTEDVSPKNVLIRAVKEESFDSRVEIPRRFKELKDTFGVKPSIEKMFVEDQAD